MDIPYAEWSAAIPIRRSRRSYDSSEIALQLLSRMQTVCHDFKPFTGVRIELITKSIDSVLAGITNSYGLIRGVTAFLAFIGDMNDPHVYEKVGYTGEGIILEATAKGLNTCWVAGTFDRRAASAIADIAKNERILTISPIGHATQAHSLTERTMIGMFKPHNRKPLSALADGLEESQRPAWMKAALESARLAPSAVNRQPWRFHLAPNSITVSVDTPKLNLSIDKRLDCGIAMLHIEVAALANGVTGKWELLESPQVARFSVKST